MKNFENRDSFMNSKINSKIVLFDSRSSFENLKDTISKEPNIHIITFDYESHKRLQKEKIPHKLSDDFIDNNECDEVQKKIFELTDWFSEKSITKFLEYRKINIGKLFDDGSTALESTVKKEAPDTEKEERGYVSLKQAYSDYTRLQDITYASMVGEITPKQMDTVDKIGERLDRSKYHSQSAEVADILVASRSTLYKIKKYAGVE